LILYHCSPRANRASINRHGLAVRFCRCPGQPRLYLVGFRHIKRAVAKVCRRHRVPANQVDVYAFDVDQRNVRQYQSHTVTLLSIAPNRLTRFAWTLSV
jgi:hypothetical protein